VVKVRGAGGGRGVPAPQGRGQGVHLGADCRDLIITAHRSLSAPVVWCWDNLNIHLAPELADFAAQNKDWLRIYRPSAYAPELNPAEGIWSLLKRPMVNFAAADLDGRSASSSAS
jgi:DDE superfamily endonuclease